MSDTTLASPVPEIPKPSNYLVRGLAIATVAAMIVCFALGTRRYIAIIKAGKAVETRFAELDAKFPFTDPGTDYRSATNVPANRIETMLDVRKQMVGSIPPDADKTAKRIYQQKESALMDRAVQLMRVAPAWKNFAMSYADALEKAGMSPAEYRWLLSYVVDWAKMYSRRLQTSYGGASMRLAGAGGGLATYGIETHPPFDDKFLDRLDEGGETMKYIDLLIIDSADRSRP